MITKLATAAALFGSLAIGGVAFAQTASSTTPAITFPIASLGNCTSREDCKKYCDDIAHADQCVAFGESHGLIKKPDAEAARAALMRFRAIVAGVHASTTPPANRPLPGAKPRIASSTEASRINQVLAQNPGPGGCTTKEACKTYCDDTSHQEECLSFAREHGLMNQQQVEQAQRLKDIVGPGGCRGAECKKYCDDAAHREECAQFAREHVLTPGLKPLEKRLATTTREKTDVRSTLPMEKPVVPPQPKAPCDLNDESCKLLKQRYQQGIGSTTRPTQLTPEELKSFKQFQERERARLQEQKARELMDDPTSMGPLNLIGSAFGALQRLLGL